MVKPVFVFLMVINFFVSVALAAEETSHGVLRCQLKDESRQRLLDEKSAGYDKPKIHLLLGTSNLVGHVRDRQGSTSESRHLELELSYQLGSTWGSARAAVDYKVTEASRVLATVSLQEPDEWGHEISLSCEFFSQANQMMRLPSTSYEYGYGNSSGFCDGVGGYFCLKRIKDDADDRAVRDAEFSCQMKNGRLDTWTKSCSNNCNPFSLPNDAPSTHVSCSSRCSVRCEIR